VAKEPRGESTTHICTFPALHPAPSRVGMLLRPELILLHTNRDVRRAAEFFVHNYLRLLLPPPSAPAPEHVLSEEAEKKGAEEEEEEEDKTTVEGSAG